MKCMFQNKHKRKGKKNMETENKTVEKSAKDELKLSPPWITYVKEVMALFGEDPEIKILYNNDECKLELMVDNHDKAEALTELLPTEKAFGNVTLKISVIPCNNLKSAPDLFRKAFNGNPAFHDMVTYSKAFMDTVTYVIFKKKVVQFFNDDLSDAHGNMSTLYKDIAKDVLGEKAGVFFCTDNGAENIGKPLGEWP